MSGIYIRLTEAYVCSEYFSLIQRSLEIWETIADCKTPV